MKKPRKKPVYMWDRCMRLMQLYTDDNPDIREIKDGFGWTTFLFPNGVRMHFRAMWRNSKVVIGLLHNANAELELSADLRDEEDLKYLSSKLNKLVAP